MMSWMGLFTALFPLDILASSTHMNVASRSTLSMYRNFTPPKCVPKGGNTACDTAGFIPSGTWRVSN
ncbi:MAG: hypothetical protein IJ467_00695 [Bacteroidaceae bacterium]|nr:hypothetical protein [Bacteroidaceae bacterium]